MTAARCSLVVVVLIVIVSCRLWPFQLAASSPLEPPPGAICILNETTSFTRAPSQLLPIFKQVPNNSIQLVRDRQRQDSTIQAASSSNNQTQVPFESICAGWENSLSGDEKSPRAFFQLDRQRRALVAKFIYYEKSQFYEKPEAKLTSPIFPPIPLYHSLIESKYYGSCKLNFDSYSMINSRLDVHYMPIATIDGGRAAQMSAGAELNHYQGILLSSFVNDNAKMVKIRVDNFKEEMAWAHHSIVMPMDENAKSNLANRTRQTPLLYKIEFSALVSRMSSSEMVTQAYLVGIAIANITLSPECYGQQVDKEELIKIGYLEQQQELYASLNRSSRDQPAQASIVNILDRFVDEHKLIIFMVVIILLISIIIIVQYLYCALQVNKPNGRRRSSIAAAAAAASRAKKTTAAAAATTTSRFGRRSIKYGGRTVAKNRQRIYTTDQQNSQSQLLYVNGSNLNNVDNKLCEQQQEIWHKHHLHSLPGLIEHVELLENPNYARLEHQDDELQEQETLIPLKPKPSIITDPDYNQYNADEWEVDMSNLIICEHIGSGAFGEVHKGQLITEKGTLMCAIKTASKTSTLQQRMDFLREASIMKKFDTFHVVKLMGVVSRTDPFYVIMEYMENGDLKSYLMSLRDLYQREKKTLVDGLYLMVAQIADGMAYLASKKFVHRDLAARNCMVGENQIVKIGDFGLTRDIYANDYYIRGTHGRLPVRWMAPESLLDNIYTSASDVWSFGIVVWEIITFSAYPYQGLSNDEVIQRVGGGFLMARPEHCPDNLYKIMQRCWQRDQNQRPTFVQIIEEILPETGDKFYPNCFYRKPEPTAQTNQQLKRTVSSEQASSNLNANSNSTVTDSSNMIQTNTTDDCKPLAALYPVVH